MLEVQCPQCKKTLRSRSAKPGGLANCPACQHIFRIPAATDEVFEGAELDLGYEEVEDNEPEQEVRRARKRRRPRDWESEPYDDRAWMHKPSDDFLSGRRLAGFAAAAFGLAVIIFGSIKGGGGGVMLASLTGLLFFIAGVYRIIRG